MLNFRKFHPGVYIKDSLDALEMTAREFSIRTGISERTLSAIINGEGNVTFDVAYKLAKFFDDSVEVWMNLQSQYDTYIRGKLIQEEIDKDWALVHDIKDFLVQYGFVQENDTKDVIVDKTRKLARVNNLTSLNSPDPFVCFKNIEAQEDTKYFLQNFWVALALNKAREKEIAPFNRKKLKESIKEIRSLTLADPKFFFTRLDEIFSECGVSFVLMPNLPNTTIYGATKWFSKDKVMLAVTNLGERSEYFWLTVFHEIVHILMEHKREMLFSLGGIDDDYTEQMAFDMLIPSDKWAEFIKNERFSSRVIQEFAAKQGILPSIVVARLHKENLAPYGKLDRFYYVPYRIQK